MAIGKNLRRILSPKYFQKIKKLYRKLKWLWYPKLTEEKFKQILINKLGVKKGCVVFLHCSINNLNLSFPFTRVLPIISEIIGEEGTLVSPCWHFNGRAEEYLKKNEVFDIKKHPTVLGAIPEIMRRSKNAQRSLHPTSSVVAIGKYALEIIKDHKNSELPCDEHSPFYKIMNYNGIIIGLGVSTSILTFVHCVEDIMKDKFPIKTRMDEIFEAKVRDQNGEVFVVKTRAAHYRIKYRNNEKYFKKNVPQEICRDIKINGTKYFKANSYELFLKMQQLAHKGKTIYTKKAFI
jgi:aminoglycoside 3-N-acetyltransferase